MAGGWTNNSPAGSETVSLGFTKILNNFSFLKTLFQKIFCYKSGDNYANGFDASGGAQYLKAGLRVYAGDPGSWEGWITGEVFWDSTNNCVKVFDSALNEGAGGTRAVARVIATFTDTSYPEGAADGDFAIQLVTYKLFIYKAVGGWIEYVAPTEVEPHTHAHGDLEGVDTDTANSSIHHTIGSGAIQAAAGNHAHPTLVVGPASSFDNRLVRYDGATGKVLQGSSISETDAGIISSGQSGAFSYLSSNLSIPPSTTSQIACTIEKFDRQNEMLNGVFTPQVGGYYFVSAGCYWENVPNGKTVKLRIMTVDGRMVEVLHKASVIGGIPISQTLSGVVYIGAGRACAVHVQHDAVAAIDLLPFDVLEGARTWFSLFKLA
jgi:hypothetical protein